MTVPPRYLRILAMGETAPLRARPIMTVPHPCRRVLAMGETAPRRARPDMTVPHRYLRILAMGETAPLRARPNMNAPPHYRRILAQLVNGNLLLGTNVREINRALHSISQIAGLQDGLHEQEASGIAGGNLEEA